MLSPPNLSKIESRMVIQTILSATIDAAGTAKNQCVLYAQVVLFCFNIYRL